MAMAMQSVSRSPRPSGLADVVELILDKGLVIDAFVRVSLVGIELLTVDARIVVASVDTYLRFAEAVNRLDLNEASDAAGLQDLTEGMGRSGGKRKAKDALSSGREKMSETFSSDDESEKQEAGDGRQRG